ncbi:hypothetical protein AALO_G00167820 [Alosa alosa]|uniref:V-SNARE coiled-coil homology domain-containing protein n=1 Tax=Alosa alosa TaxID=278164 RepID=A0AAV6GBY3_9TELE|nr:vesicle-associated membrane protein 714-like [Alosa sapidissima]KAG5272648.1 hypothetical protein AALO_G00167820 [Alosa alosa]
MTDKLQQVQQDVEEVKVLMVENVNKADERGDKLTDLDERAAKLLNSSHSFHKQSKKVLVKQKRENLKGKIGIIAIVVVLFLIIIIVAIVMLSTSDGGPTTASNNAITPMPTESSGRN